jgi:hypothetical protein
MFYLRLCYVVGKSMKKEELLQKILQADEAVKDAIFTDMIRNDNEMVLSLIMASTVVQALLECSSAAATVESDAVAAPLVNNNSGRGQLAVSRVGRRKKRKLNEPSVSLMQASPLYHAAINAFECDLWRGGSTVGFGFAYAVWSCVSCYVEGVCSSSSFCEDSFFCGCLG